MAQNALVLLSGGIDSAVCAHLLAHQGHHVSGVFVDYGQAARNFEREAAARVSASLGIPLQHVAYHAGRSFAVGEILGRNAFLVFAALLSTQGMHTIISLGIHEDSLYYDCSDIFRSRLAMIVSECSNGRIQISTPVLAWTKRDIVTYALANGLRIADVYSCEAGTLPPCGTCNSCREWEGLDVRKT
jgi:7-cyano-7-deazaguanine synthase